MASLFCAFSLLSACGSSVAVTTTRPEAQRPGAIVSTPESPQEDATIAPDPTGLYSPEEALRDALAGTLVHMGTGTWPGDGRMPACAFKNGRVIVVLAYCSQEETQAFRVHVYSPAHGRVVVYAESKTPLSAHRRSQYFTFTAQTEPAPGPETNLPTLDLDSVSFETLKQYEAQRYLLYLPACYGGVEHGRSQSGCLGTLGAHAEGWAQRHQDFFARANSDWYFVVSELRALAKRYGRNPD